MDVFLDRVSELAGRTARVLDTAAAEIKADYVNQAAILQRVAEEHKKIVLDCLSETQPISVRRLPIGRQLRDLAEATRQLAAELLQRRLAGHDIISEVADGLEEVAKSVDEQLDD